MILKNALVGGKRQHIVLENGVIREVTARPVGRGEDLAGKRVIPGLIDIHTHGCIGLDTMDADFEKMCSFYASRGTTSWLPTTMTMAHEALLRVCDAKTDFPGAQILGFHLEGPYISEQQKGAQNQTYIRHPSLEEFRQYQHVKMITLAPELPGSMDFIKAVGGDCVVSIGHTACDYETAKTAIESGARCLTHLYNAMPPFHHRAPGPIGAAFEKHIYAQLIGDGFHIAKPAVLAAWRLFGSDRLILISDSIRPAGLADGEYEAGGLSVTLKDGAVRLSDGTIAGSIATLWDCVKTVTSFGVPFEEAVKMASETPADLLGVKKGRIEPGYDADLLIVNDQTEIETVIIGGNVLKR
ncbi:MAG: N-acetylglucosamine-6-phosphate deacetylase [Clostridia bacterium]|nr:N-acetylglucosamine-6-phosphate deacetylase [Clostridia bacterium]